MLLKITYPNAMFHSAEWIIIWFLFIIIHLKIEVYKVIPTKQLFSQQNQQTGQ